MNTKIRIQIKYRGSYTTEFNLEDRNDQEKNAAIIASTLSTKISKKKAKTDADLIASLMTGEEPIYA